MGRWHSPNASVGIMTAVCGATVDALPRSVSFRLRMDAAEPSSGASRRCFNIVSDKQHEERIGSTSLNADHFKCASQCKVPYSSIAPATYRRHETAVDGISASSEIVLHSTLTAPKPHGSSNYRGSFPGPSGRLAAAGSGCA